MLYHKITHGYVRQVFNDAGEFLKQEFVADNGEVIYELEDGHEINVENMPLAGREYEPFNMANPTELIEARERTKRDIRKRLDSIDDDILDDLECIIADNLNPIIRKM
jgi:hypothetical protein